MNFIPYPNVPRAIGVALGSGKVTLKELQEYYSAEDLYDLLEVLSIDSHNSALAHKNERQ